MGIRGSKDDEPSPSSGRLTAPLRGKPVGRPFIADRWNWLTEGKELKMSRVSPILFALIIGASTFEPAVAKDIFDLKAQRKVGVTEQSKLATLYLVVNSLPRDGYVRGQDDFKPGREYNL